jgi:hypothetical protein
MGATKETKEVGEERSGHLSRQAVNINGEVHAAEYDSIVVDGPWAVHFLWYNLREERSTVFMDWV